MPTIQEELEEAGFEGMWEELEAGNLELKEIFNGNGNFSRLLYWSRWFC